MKTILLIVSHIFAVQLFSQATESAITFPLDTDGDLIINVIDTDDDNDGVLDNLDVYPLDNTKSAVGVLTQQIMATADASCRDNGSNGGKNYGIEPSSDLNSGINRYQIIKFNKPAFSNIVTATLTIYTNTENDALQIFSQADNSWLEGTLNGGTSNGTTQGITYTGNNTNFTNKVLLGTTSIPSAGKCTLTLPLSSIPISGEFTIIVMDQADATIESIYARETPGKGATVDFSYNETIAPRLVIDQSSGTSEYLGTGTFMPTFKLSQAPSGTVYVPFVISNSATAQIIGNQVLAFTSANWNTPQTLSIDPQAPGTFDIAIRPLHSTDNFYNGNNPDDLTAFTVQASDITNLGPYNAMTNTLFTTTLTAISAVGSTSHTFKIVTGPVGLGVVENSGKINFMPLSYQVGTHLITIEVTDSFGNKSLFNTSITVTSSGTPDPVGKYVIPNATVNGTGTAANPYNDIPYAVAQAALAGGGNVFVRGGVYELDEIQYIPTAGSSANPIVIKPAPGETVKFDFGIKANGFEFEATSMHIIFEGFEIDGGTDNVEFWCLPAQAFWGDKTVFRGGGIAIGLNGENLTIRNNYIHNCYQKAIEIRTARYLKVYDNIIHSIATTSLSGGHGIMRQQSSGPITTPDDYTNGVEYRWDLMGNLIFNVEQRIYSWVPSKGFIDMVLDEGKPILIDDVPPADVSGADGTMKARIMNNVVAFGAIDQIRLKSTSNLTVSNNTVYSASPAADGITDKVGDTNTPKFRNTTFTNNAVQTMPGTAAFEMSDIVAQGNSTTPATFTNNYAAVGNILPGSLVGNGFTVATAPLFVDPNNGNFRLSSGFPTDLGVASATLDNMDANVAKFAVNVKWDRWDNDHLKLTQTILDNAPGVNDGVVGNETVVTDFGIMHLNALPARSEIEFTVVNGTWKTEQGAPAHEDFELHPEYAAWYKARNAATKKASGANYERIRWGNSVLKQDQVFDNDWLTVTEITAVDTNTVIEGKDENFTLDGDILIDFEGYTPVGGEEFDIIVAKTITTANGASLFDRVLFEGYTPPNYSLAIVSVPGGQAVRLKILGSCNLLVENTNDVGGGTLRAAIACATDGSTINLSNVIANDTIQLLTPLLIDKSLSFVSASNTIRIQNCSTGNIETSVGKTISMSNFHIMTNTFINNATMTATDMIFSRKDGTPVINFINNTGAQLNIINQVTIK